MAGYTDSERLKLVFKVQAANVIDAASNFSWYEAKFAFNPNIAANRVLTQFAAIKANPVANKAAALALLGNGNPLDGIVANAYTTGIRLTQVISGNNTTWVVAGTYNDITTQILDWIQPQKILQASGSPSIGWACLLYTSPSPRDRQKSRMPSSA